jgi:hypothetical protein
VSLHSRAACENVLDGIVKNVTKGEDASDVWRRYHDREPRLCRFGVGMKYAAVEPSLVPFWLNYFWIVGFRQLGYRDTVAQASRLQCECRLGPRRAWITSYDHTQRASSRASVEGSAVLP